MSDAGSLLDDFMPHGMCYQWRPDILWLNVISDSIIAIAYFLIPAALVYYARRKPLIHYRSVLYMFVAFIGACGFTHLFGITTVWNGMYGVQGLIKSFTAATSIATAVMLIPIIPKLLALRTPVELEEANARLQIQIEQRINSEQQLLRLQSEVARFGRINTVGQFTTGLAHELNQPLLAISASADTAVRVARAEPATDPLLFECLDDVQRDTQRAGEILRTLRQFISDKTAERSLIDINKLVEQAMLLITGDSRNSDIKCVVDTSNGVPAVRANSVQISQVLVNLLRNAVEAMEEADAVPASNTHKRITVTTRHDNDQVIVSVADTGPGVSDRKKMFTPFESSKADGMGVGLSISRDIVEAHGGLLEYKGASGGGALFTFNIPASKDPIGLEHFA